jgi:hypothetical protein
VDSGTEEWLSNENEDVCGFCLPVGYKYTTAEWFVIRGVDKAAADDRQV